MLRPSGSADRHRENGACSLKRLKRVAHNDPLATAKQTAFPAPIPGHRIQPTISVASGRSKGIDEAGHDVTDVLVRDLEIPPLRSM